MEHESAVEHITKISNALARVMQSLIGKKIHALKPDLQIIRELRAEIQSYGYRVSVEVIGNEKGDTVVSTRALVVKPGTENEKSRALYSAWFAQANGIALP